MTVPVKKLPSAGRHLPVADDGRLHRWWPTLHGRIPGTTAAAPEPVPGAEAVVDVTDCGNPSHARQVINAHLHLLHLLHDTLSVHAVALTVPSGDGAVLLLGGHGAGKTLVATALALAGWMPIAGDVTLVRVGEDTTTVVGGTTAFMVRTAPTARWFPHVPRPEEEFADLGHLWGLRPASTAVPVLDAVWVQVDGDPRLEGARAEPMDAHTARSLWWTASAHLLDRVTPVGCDPLRLLEPPILARHRDALSRTAADRFAPTVLWGEPHAIAATITRTLLERSDR